MLRDYQPIIGHFQKFDAAFEKACIWILTEAFKTMKEEGKYDLSWKEPRFSAVLIGQMRKIKNRKNWPLGIEPESHLYTEEMLEGAFDPDTAPRIDIKCLGGWRREEVYYGIEAKIVVEQNWEKRNANGLCERYIKTGIDNFVKGRYSDKLPRGCITGYVIQGIAQNIALNINNLLQIRGRHGEIMENHHVFNDCSDCYQSGHTRITDHQAIGLHHVFLTFC